MYGSSRLGKSLVAAVNATATGFTTRFGIETYQIRVESGQGLWMKIFDSTTLTTSFVSGSTSTATSTATDVGIPGTYMAASEWDYFTVTPGQFLCWKSTSTSTNAWISVTEMS